MADISKITLPNGDQYNIKDSTAVRGVKGDAEASYRTGTVNITPTNLGLGTAALLDSASTVTNSSTTLPTGAAVLDRINNHIVFSKTQPTNQVAGDIWFVIADTVGPVNGDSASYGSTT